jgi:hypothetical protein
VDSSVPTLYGSGLIRDRLYQENRLRTIKPKCDPDNEFSFAHSIPPALPGRRCIGGRFS